MTKKEILDTGRHVLRIEAGAVDSLSRRLDDSFVRAVDLLYKSKARIIIIGMGKSGLVGRKIAATLASCGTPAMFVHPAEAGHGDLGMILRDDVIVAVSYSGETREIVDLLDFIKRIGVKLICITGSRNSRIARYSDIVLDAAVEKEAEPAGLVPTASSTAALALGDALAVAVMKKRRFSEKDFAFVHPKGAIGKKLLRVESLMHKGRGIPSVSPETAMGDVIEEMTKKKLGMTCVVGADGTLVGIITDGDLRRMVRKYGQAFFLKTARNCMKADPITIDKSDLATEALNLMERNRITSLVIRNKSGKLEGIIHLHDLWRTEMF
jgi:arabinose-5-phosphate isomerase